MSTAEETPLWLVEYYRKHPVTGEEGWTIHFAWVRAYTHTDARNRLRLADPLFDVVITCSRAYEVLPIGGLQNPLLLL